MRLSCLAVAALLAPSGCTLIELPEEGHAGGATSVGGGGSGAGVDGPACESAADCPLPENPCDAAACVEGACGVVARGYGELLAPGDQIAGDCRVNVCDGTGHVVEQNDDEDTPEDMRVCTDDECREGSAINVPHELNSVCGNDAICDADGNCVECNVDSDCGTDGETECQWKVCSPQGTCELENAIDGTPLFLQAAQDCRVIVCDGAGGTRDDYDPGDTPDDHNDCTFDFCNAITGMPDHGYQPATATCGLAGALQCDGNGHCGCTDADECGAVESCRSPICDGMGFCGWDNAPEGTTLGVAQTANDCLLHQCDGDGNVEAIADNADLPLDIGQCSAESCNAGVASHPPELLNTACSEDGGSVCDGEGACVACNSGSQCPPGGACEAAVCVAHSCDLDPLPDGTLSPNNTAGDCQRVLCDGDGNEYSEDNPSDLPNDGLDCTSDQCSGGMPIYPPVAAGLACNDMGGSYCDGSGDCVECVLDSHCDNGLYCRTEACVAKLPLGMLCGRNAMCQSGYCVDGVCCTGPCTGTCRGCSSALTGQANGVCAPVRNYTDPSNECTGAQVCYGGGCCLPDGGTSGMPMAPVTPVPVCP